jgi:hypothetical protein
MKLWRQSASFAPRRSGFDSRRLHFASVVSTASTRPLYGRGAGSIPAGGSFTRARSSAERALLCDGRGRWFESSRAYRPSSQEARGVNGKHSELQPRWSGFDPWRACSNHDRRGPEWLGYLVRACTLVPLRFDSASRPHPTTATNDLLRAGTVSGYRLLIDRSRVRVPPGALPCSGSSAGRAVPGRTATTAAVTDHRGGSHVIPASVRAASRLDRAAHRVRPCRRVFAAEPTGPLR